MRPRDLLDLLLLAALWGASFLFMRVAAEPFGPFALIELRVAIAAACLLPLAVTGGRLQVLRAHARPIAVTGLINSALPFMLFGYAALSLTAGFMALLNSTAPLWGALVGWWWLKDRPDASRAAGLALGFAGVAMLAWPRASFRPGGSGLAVVACLGAALAYGIGASYAKRALIGVDALATAAGSQLAAALAVLPWAVWYWPAEMPDALHWAAVAMLGVASTGIAYVLYFRLITRVGASRAITVTFLVPVFATFWGAIFLGEVITAEMIAGGAVVLTGTALAAGVLRLSRRS